MPTNVLYRLIQQNPNNIPEIIRLLPLKHPEGKKYLLLELPIMQIKGVGDYLLTSHHLNVNETIGAIDLDSQYHYTAYFTDKAGKKYRLHIYYNAHDGAITEPLFDDITDNVPKHVDCFEHHETFKLLADSAKAQVIAHIRAIQNKKIKALEAEFVVLERQATGLSKELDKNKAAYLENIDKQIAVLEQLPLYANKIPAIVSYIPYLKRLKKAVEFKVEVKTQLPEGKQSQLAIPKQKKKTVAEELFAGVAVVQDDVVVIKAGLSQEIIALQKKFEALKTIKGHDLINALTDLFAKITEIEFELDKDIYTCTVKNIHDLRLLKNKLENQGKKLLLISLTSDSSSDAEERANYLRAKQLKVFHSCLLDPVIKLDLIKRKKPLLIEFLIENKLLSLQEMNESLIPYYFKQAVGLTASPTTAAVVKPSLDTILVQCLNVLIKNGASLMEMDKESGMPFVVVLLLNSKHTLYPVLVQNANLTVNNFIFLKQLIQVLRVLQTHAVDKSQMDLIVDRCTATVSALQAQKLNVGMAFLESHRKELVVQARRTLGEAVLERLHADPGVIALCDYVNREWLKFIAKLPSASKLAFNNIVKKNEKAATQFLAVLKTFGVEFTFEELKASFIENQRYSLETIALNEQLFAVQDRLKQIRSAIKLNREQRSLLKQQKEIMDRLVVIQKVSEVPSFPESMASNLQSVFSLFSSEDSKSSGSESLNADSGVETAAHERTDYKSSRSVSPSMSQGQSPHVFFSPNGVERETRAVDEAPRIMVIKEILGGYLSSGGLA